MAKKRLFLQAYADKVSTSSLKVTFIKVFQMETDGHVYSREVKEYLLPEKKSDFMKLTEELYVDSLPQDRPTYVSKTEFHNEFIKYTLENINYTTCNPENITKHYNTVFQLKAQEALVAFIDADLAAVTEGAKAFLNSLSSEAQTSYEQAKSTLNPSIGDFAAPDLPPASINPDLLAANDSAVVNADNNTRAIFSGIKPTIGDMRPVTNMSGIGSATRRNLHSLPEDISTDLLGFGGDKLIEPVPELLTYPGDAHYESENNSGLVLGRDEFYRIRGHHHAGACYLYAGRDPGPDGVQTEVADTEGNLLSVRKPKDLVKDAAYLYLSQKCDPDELLKIAGGTYSKVLASSGDSETTVSPRQGTSLAVLQADDLVLIGENSGIRLITGRSKVNSQGGDILGKFGIDLIAGNNDEDLQPLVKGENLVQYLQGLSKSLSELRAIVYSHITSQIDLQRTVMNHTHYDPFLIFLGSLAYGNPLAVNDGKSFQSSELYESGTKALLEFAQQQSNMLSMERNRNANDEAAGLTGMVFGEYPILSERNRTN